MSKPFLASLALATSICAQGALAADPIQQLVEQFLKVRTPSRPDFAADGSLYVIDFPDGTNQLYRVASGQVADAAGAMTKISTFKDGISGFSISPDGKSIILSAAEGGNENTQLYTLDASNAIKKIVGAPKVVTTLATWTDDSTAFLYTANDTSPSDFHVSLWNLATGTQTKLLAKAGQWTPEAITSDGKRMLVEEYFSASDSKIYEVDISDRAMDPAKRTLKELTHTKSGSTAANHLAGYLPGDTAILLTSDIEGNARLYQKDLSSGKVSSPVSSLNNFEIETAGVSEDQKHLAVVTNEDGYGVIHLYTLPDFKEIKLPEMDKGVLSLTSLRNDTVVWTVSNARTANVSYSWKIGSTQAPRAVTKADTNGLNLGEFPLPELVKFKAFDNTEIPAFMYLPPGFKKGAPIPFVVNYHGGPEGQFRPQFDRTAQILSKLGFGVLQPNVRGSSGYGREFQMKDDYKLRWDSVRDGVDAAKWLVTSGYATAGKISTYGGSYGGFMSVATLVEDQERVDRKEQPARLFGAGIDVVGIVNLKTFLEQTSGYRRKLRESEYGPLSDPDFLNSVSSIHKIDKLQVPMLIAHGLNDPRVPVGEAMQLATALQSRGYDPELIFCPDEGHGFAKLPNRILFNTRMAKFLLKNIATK